MLWRVGVGARAGSSWVGRWAGRYWGGQEDRTCATLRPSAPNPNLNPNPNPDPDQDVCDIAASVEGGSITAICDLIVLKAAERWEEEEGDYRDDITAVVISFPWIPGGSA